MNSEIKKLNTQAEGFSKKINQAIDEIKKAVVGQETVIEKLMKSYSIKSDFIPSLININESPLEILVKHPYISFDEARLLVAYRNQHGPFLEYQSILNIPIIDEAKLEMLKPYILISN